MVSKQACLYLTSQALCYSLVGQVTLCQYWNTTVSCSEMQYHHATTAPTVLCQLVHLSGSQRGLSVPCPAGSEVLLDTIVNIQGPIHILQQGLLCSNVSHAPKHGAQRPKECSAAMLHNYWRLAFTLPSTTCCSPCPHWLGRCCCRAADR
jgi:hypothetical protein